MHSALFTQPQLLRENKLLMSGMGESKPKSAREMETKYFFMF